MIILLFQISSLVFAPNYKELVSAHGYAHNNVVIWKYPALTRVAELNGKYLFFIFYFLYLSGLALYFNFSLKRGATWLTW